MGSKTYPLIPRKKKLKPCYFHHPFKCAFSTRRMASPDCNQLRKPRSRKGTYECHTEKPTPQGEDDLPLFAGVKL